jgi:hypothetical protein
MYVYIALSNNTPFGPVTVSYTQNINGPTGPAISDIQYVSLTYGAFIEPSTGMLAFNAGMGTALSSTALNPPFSLVFTFSGVTSIGSPNAVEHFIGVTDAIGRNDSNKLALVHGFFLQDQYSVYQRTNYVFGQGSTPLIDIPKAASAPAYTANPGATYTYQLINDGVNIRHFLNNIPMGNPVFNTRPGPFYPYIRTTGGMFGPMSISYQPMSPSYTGPTGFTGVTGPLGPTGVTGGVPSYLQYSTLTKGVSIDPSTGMFIFSGGKGYILSSTSLVPPYSLMFVFSGLKDTSKEQRFGVTNTPANPSLTHGLFNQNTSTLNICNNSINTPRTYTSPTYSPSIPPGLETYTYQLIHDGAANLTHYLNGILMGNSVLNTKTGPFYVFVDLDTNGAGGINGPMSIFYQPLGIGMTGPLGPTGQLGPTGSTISARMAVNTVFIYRTPPSGGVSVVPGPGTPGSGGAEVKYGNPLGPNYLPSSTTPEGDLRSIPLLSSSWSSNLLTITSGQASMVNSNTFPIDLTIKGALYKAPNFDIPSPPPSNNCYFIIDSAGGNTIVTPTMALIGLSYSITLKLNDKIRMFIGPQSGTILPNVFYTISFTQLPIQAGGRIIDVVPGLKPKLRKTSIRVKKGRKQTAKYRVVPK